MSDNIESNTAAMAILNRIMFGVASYRKSVDEALADWESDCEDGESYATREFFPGETYTFKIGPKEVSFYVKQDLLEKSRVFDRMATNTNGREYHSKYVRLPKENPKYFAYLIEFFKKGVYDTHEESGEELLHELCRMYIVADEYDVHDLKIDLVKRLAHFSCEEDIACVFRWFHEPFVANVCAVYDRLSASDWVFRDYIQQTFFFYYVHMTTFGIRPESLNVNLLLRRGGHLAEDVFTGTRRAMKLVTSKSSRYLWVQYLREARTYKNFKSFGLKTEDN